MAAALSLLDALPDFSSAVAQAVNAPDIRVEPPVVERKNAPPAKRAEAEDAHRSRIEAAEAALADRLRQEHEAAIEALRSRHAEEIEALHAQLAIQAGETIRARFAEMEEQIIGLATGATARILGMRLSRELQERSVSALERIIRDAISEREIVRIQVNGAALLWDALRKGLGDKARHIEFSEGSAFDLTVSIDEQLFETRLAEWSDALAGVIA